MRPSPVPHPVARLGVSAGDRPCRPGQAAYFTGTSTFLASAATGRGIVTSSTPSL